MTDRIIPKRRARRRAHDEGHAWLLRRCSEAARSGGVVSPEQLTEMRADFKRRRAAGERFAYVDAQLDRALRLTVGGDVAGGDVAGARSARSALNKLDRVLLGGVR